MKRAQRKALLKQARRARERSKPRPVTAVDFGIGGGHPVGEAAVAVARSTEPKTVAIVGPYSEILSYMRTLGVVLVDSRDAEKPADVVTIKNLE